MTDGSGVTGVEEPSRFALIGPTSLQKAQEWAFVLRSVGLDGVVRPMETGGYVLMVLATQRDRAIETLRTYEVENLDFPPKKKADRPLYASSSWALGIVAAMVAFFMTTGPAVSQSKWFRAGIADTDRLLHGAPWQAVTALTLHSDASHVFGNAISGAIFLGAVHRRLGAGVGTFTVLAAGAAGNALNAVWHRTGHHSLGASTAVFAAIGVLAATQVVLNRSAARGWMSYVAPVLGGLALLGTLGAGAQTDLHAHGFGFLAGAALGAVAAWPVRARTSPLPVGVQAGFGVASAAVVAGSWALALRSLGA